MAPQEPPSLPAVGSREERLLARLADKYERERASTRLRSYLIAGAAIFLLFALSRWIPWWWAAILIVEALGLAVFHQYKRFARFKSQLLAKLGRERAASALNADVSTSERLNE